MTTVGSPLQDPAESGLRRHEKYWFDDGSLVLRAHNDIFKVHRTLLHRHSKTLASLSTSENDSTHHLDDVAVQHIPEHLDVRSQDVETLLQHLYHDQPLGDDTLFSSLAALFKVSSKQQLDFPEIHALARSRLERLFTTSPEAFSRPENAEEALALAVKYDIPSIRKTLYYTVATHPHEAEDPAPDVSEDAPKSHPHLSPELSVRCDALLEKLVDQFTPVLFTVATAGHMACTGVFAEKWMTLVIGPALEDNGLCRPLETLDRIIGIDWAAEGVCTECVRDKTDEWRAEQREVWARIDDWLR
ncbi:hypothetical protein C8Q80DRAFT_1184827 [Daedaleopsis nitida]|nr:hypothetical protein C8Q80DRAFT_1184827 [Daedaleopsis nitida]